MATDNDLSALLPEPPPARPARREAAIDEALRRFDGGGQSAPSPPVKARPAPAREGWGRPQIAALASVALVVLFTVPIWWAEKDRLSSDFPQAPPLAQDPPGLAPEPAPRAPQQATPPGTPPTAASPSPPDAPVAIPQPSPDAFDVGPASPVPGPAPPPPAARSAPSPREVSEGTIVVTGSRVVQQAFDSPSAVTAVSSEVLPSQDDRKACTILDPRRDLSACRAFAPPGSSGPAARHLTDGLGLAWEGELDPAIDAFDRAIRTAPDLSVAYLNRGLAYQSKGNLRRALADLNRAVRKNPDSARGYYHRSLLYRARGDTERADADARRAVELDPGYEAALP
jgi:hypothetical protein